MVRGLAVVLLALAATGCEARMGPLHEAAATGNVEFVRAWIAKKGDLDAGFDESSHGLEGNSGLLRGVTALMLAARVGNLEIVRLLVENGANIHAEARPRDERPDWSYRRTAFDFAFDNAMDRGTNAAEILEVLWTRSDRVRFAARLDRQIPYACSRYCNDKAGGDAHSNPALLLISIADDEPRGRGVSQAACVSPQPLALLAFLDRHAVRFPKNTLHCAAYGDNARSLRSLEQRMAIIGFFLEHGANLEDLGISKYATALMGAASAHDTAMVTFLLARGANPNTRNSVGFNSVISAGSSCVHSAAGAAPDPRQQAQLATIEILRQAGASLELPDQKQPWLMRNCCKQEPRGTTQQQICRTYGL
jgi:ankyrin repeat protein